MRPRRQPLVALLLLASCLPPASVPSSEPAAPEQPRRRGTARTPESQARAPELPKVHKGECAAEIAELPAAYLGTRVLVRLPKGVSAGDLADVDRDHAQLLAPVTLPTCSRTQPTVRLVRMALTLHDPDPGSSLEQLRDEFLAAQGLLERATLVEQTVDQHSRRGKWVYELASTKLLVSIDSDRTRVTLVGYEVETAGWSLVVDTLLASSRRISLLAP